MNRLLPFGVLGAAFLLAPSGAAGAELWVGPVETYTSIDSAVADAQAGDFIHVKGGTYGGFTLSVPVTVQGDAGPEATFITSQVLIEASASGSEIRGFGFNTDLPEPSLFISGATSVEDVTFEGLSAWAALAVADTSATLTGITCQDNWLGTCVFGSNATLTIYASTFERNRTDGQGPALLTRGGSVVIEDSVFRDNESVYGAGALFVVDGDGVIRGSTFERNRVTYDGGYGGAVRAGIYVDSTGEPPATLVIEECAFVDNEADYGAVAMFDGASLDIHDSTFDLKPTADGTSAGVVFRQSDAASIARTSFSGGGSRAWQGAVVMGSQIGTLALEDVQIVDVTDSTSVVAVWNAAELRARRLTVSHSELDQLFFVGLAGEAAVLDLDAIAACGNTTATGRLGLVTLDDTLLTGGTFDARHITMVEAEGALVDSPTASVAVANSLFGGTPTFDGAVTWSTTGTTSAAVVSGVTNMDPGLGAFETAGCDFALLQPDPRGPAADTGDGLDRDGSIADLGALGGPEALVLTDADDADRDGVGWYHDCDDEDEDVRPTADEVAYDGVDNDCLDGDECDVDGDGVFALLGTCGGQDCDDGQAASHPGAAEVPYDGIDNDCLDGDACDVDGDGEKSSVPACAGSDCDDADGSRFTASTDVPGDGIDQNCDGSDEEEPSPSYRIAGTCATAPGRTSVVWLALAVIALARRARR